MGKDILYIVFSQTFFLICSYINFLQGIKSYHKFNTIHIYYLTVSVSGARHGFTETFARLQSSVCQGCVLIWRVSQEGICLLTPMIIDSISFLTSGGLMKACFFKASRGETPEQVC